MHNTGADTPTDEPVRVWNAAGRGGVVLICEHASNHIPALYAQLGLPPQALQTHIAWDPGALDVARHMVLKLFHHIENNLLSKRC